MPTAHPPSDARPDLSVNPIFTRQPMHIPRYRLPDGELDADVAYQIVHDELMLDGNARLNLATFVTTWMEPQAGALMAECSRQEHDRQGRVPAHGRAGAALRADARRPLARARPRRRRLLDDRLERGLHARRAGAQAPLAAAAGRPGKPADRPNLVMGINVQICWDKFCNYCDVEPRLVPMEGDRLHLGAAEAAVAACDENTIGVVAILGSTFDGSYEPVAAICAALDDSSSAPASTSRCTSTGPPAP